MAGMYNSSKAALHAMSDALRVELSPFDVKVTTVFTCPMIEDYKKSNLCLRWCLDSTSLDFSRIRASLNFLRVRFSPSRQAKSMAL